MPVDQRNGNYLEALSRERGDAFYASDIGQGSIGYCSISTTQVEQKTPCRDVCPTCSIPFPTQAEPLSPGSEARKTTAHGRQGPREVAGQSWPCGQRAFCGKGLGGCRVSLMNALPWYS